MDEGESIAVDVVQELLVVPADHGLIWNCWLVAGDGFSGPENALRVQLLLLRRWRSVLLRVKL